MILGFGLTLSEIQKSPEQTQEAFEEFLQAHDPLLHARYRDALGTPAVMLELAPYVEDFMSELFGLRTQLQKRSKWHQDIMLILKARRTFVLKQVLAQDVQSLVENWPTLAPFLPPHTTRHDDKILAEHFLKWESGEAYDAARAYAAWACTTEAGRSLHKNSVLFSPIEKKTLWERFAHDAPVTFVPRDGFNKTDPGVSPETVLKEAHYCLKCHVRNKDSCSKAPEGCPLEEHISEMMQLLEEGYVIAPLLVAMINNPLLAATGHRICNDCVKACIFQKQQAVAVPEAETGTLEAVLTLPYGVEMYLLFTQWNPFNLKVPLPQPAQHKNVLVVGMGPAGFSAAYHLLRLGYTVVGVDGLKIEPLPFDPHTLIQDISQIRVPLETRSIGGFGGVAEYGITVRWDKTYLTLIRLVLERHDRFLLKGGIQYGGQLTRDRAISLGFHHVALALGGGQPRQPEIAKAWPRGVRHAADFLMALQLTGAYKKESLANLLIELPAVVVGGGLTAVDAATEVQAYYIRMVEKIATYVEDLDPLAICSEKLERFLSHAKAIKNERALAQKENRPPNFLPLLQEWGGVTVLYRGDWAQAPSVRLNPEEVFHARTEGIQLLGHRSIQSLLTDAEGAVRGLQCTHQGQLEEIPARTVLMALGSIPCAQDDDQVTYLGDMVPEFRGSVVKAMASVVAALPSMQERLAASSSSTEKKFLARIDDLLTAKVTRLIHHTPRVLEIVVRAPLAAQNFAPGQFYRLQNFEADAHRLQMEGLALTGAAHDVAQGEVSLIVLMEGVSSRLCATLQSGQEVVLMGPTGAPSHIPENQNVLLIGGGLGNAVLFSIGRAMRAQGCRVVYFAGYRTPQDCFRQQDLEDAADQVVWCYENTADLPTIRPQDRLVHGNLVQALEAYRTNTLDAPLFDLTQTEHLLVIGSDGLMKAVSDWTKTYAQDLPALKSAEASINSPMQCMMKGVCGQCVQRQVDPKTGQERYVYSCAKQDQPLTHVDFTNLRQRLAQNDLMEHLSALWAKSHNIHSD